MAALWPTFMHKKMLGTFFLAALLAGRALGGQPPIPDQTAADTAALKSATKVTITESCPGQSRTNKLIINQAVEVSHVLSTIRLKPQPPGVACYGVHIHDAIFKTPSGEVRVSFCQQCFDVQDPVDERHYQMPKEFYAEIRNQLKKQGQLTWEGLKP